MSGPEPTHESGAAGCVWIVAWAVFCAVLMFTASLVAHRACVREQAQPQITFVNNTDSVMIVDIQRYPSCFHLYPGETYTRSAVGPSGNGPLGRVFAAHTRSGCYLQMGIVQETNTLTITTR